MTLSRSAAASLSLSLVLVAGAASAQVGVGVDVNIGVGVGAQPPPAAQPPPPPAAGPVYAPPPAAGPVAQSTPTPSNGAWVPPPPPPRHEHKSLTLDINVFSLMLGRIGPNIQILPQAHHAVVINPFWLATAERSARYTVVSNGQTTTEGWKATFGGYGLEAGYRYYTAHHSAQGLYIGPSIILGQFRATEPGATESKQVTVYGWALDVGFQMVFYSGFTIGAGIGIQNTMADKAIDLDRPNTYSALTGFKGRFLTALGWSY